MGRESISMVYGPIAGTAGISYHGTWLYANSAGNKFVLAGSYENTSLNPAHKGAPYNIAQVPLAAEGIAGTTSAYGKLITITGLLRYLGVAALTFLTAPATQAGQDAPEQTQAQTMRKSAELIAARGQELRRAIDTAYLALKDHGQIRSSGHGTNSITPVVSAFIPAGTSFSEAESILRAAGFKLGKRGRSSLFHDKSWVVATIDQYRPTPYGRTSITVFVEPTDPADWLTVRSVEAAIVVEMI